jgi:hypothetical protein
LEIAWVRSFFEPHPKLQPPERSASRVACFRSCAVRLHPYELRALRQTSRAVL